MKYYLTPEAIEAGCKFEKPRDGDAGYDIYAAETIEFMPGQVSTVRTGLYISIPQGYVGIVKDRSSMAMAGLHIHAGVIDSAYRGEIKLVICDVDLYSHIHPLEEFIRRMTGVHVAKSEVELRHFRARSEQLNRVTVNAGDKIAQLLIVPVHTPRLIKVSSIESLGITERGDKGFGSTDE